MANNGTRMLFVNLAVKDLPRSMNFFRGLGFDFNPQFTDDNAACMIFNEQAYAMLLTERFFQGFTKRSLCDTQTQTEALLAVSCKSRDEVNEMVEKALASGGSKAMEPMDHGWMYGWSFYDPDGHHWEVLYMDSAAIPAKP
jgi:uncharacterized protein